MSAATPTRPARTVELTGVPADLAAQIELAREQEHEGETVLEYWTRIRDGREARRPVLAAVRNPDGARSLLSKMVLHALSYQQSRVKLADEQILSEQRLIADLQRRHDE